MKISATYGVLVVLGLACLATGFESCRTPDGKQGECILIFDCDKVYRMVRKRDDYSMKYLRESICKNERETFVCCERVAYVPPPPPTPRRTPYNWIY